MTPSHTSQPSSIARKPARASLLVVARTLILPRWKLLLTGLGLIVVSRMCGLVLPYSSKILIDDIIGAGKYSIYTFAALVAVAVLAQAVTSFLLTIILSVEAQHMIAKLRAKVQHLSLIHI